MAVEMQEWRGGRRRGDGEGGGRERSGKHLFPLFDDLTRINYMKMKAIGNDERVQACWTVRGQIRFKLHDSEVVKKVLSVFDPIDKLIK